ncbi:hypothetical protein [Leisingera sp. ANG59]|uniref:hypothetical protein n=1 Tax=Leisingera sp. ANG59 TaxID=2675221 RepID=UPI0020C7164D|nr:hypothetical protein [Leisingera sp. ANG59]
MDDRKNPLQDIPLSTAHMLMQLLAWMWSAVFSIAIGSYFAFGITSIAHILILGAVFTTLIVFQTARK